MSDFNVAGRVGQRRATAHIQYPTIDKKIGTMKVDAFISENHAMSKSVTSIPVEDGDTFSDHMVADPRTISINACFGVSEFKAYTDAETSTPGTDSVMRQRQKEMFQKLEALHEANETISLVTGLKTYVDMAITNIQVTRDAQAGQGLEFTMDLQQIKKTKSKSTITTKESLGNSTSLAQANSTLQAGKTTPEEQYKDKFTEGYREAYPKGTL